MKTIPLFKRALLVALFLPMLSCGDDDNQNPVNPQAVTATAESFAALRETALADMTQHFTVDMSQTSMTFTSQKGVAVTINPYFTLNGTPVTGTIDLEFVEIFDSADMVLTNKPTMGNAGNGVRKMLLSGGEFYFSAMKNGQRLDNFSTIQLTIPADLTGIPNEQMTLWKGVIDTVAVEQNLVWDELEPQVDPIGGENGVFVQGDYYFAYYSFNGGFPWTNVDCFYSDNRPKTTLLANVPDGYDNENSAVYLSYDGQGNALAQLDTYTAAGLFSEHYGQIPIGLECHAIFITEENGLYKYAIKAVTIEANETIEFSGAEMSTGTKAQLQTAIHAIQS